MSEKDSAQRDLLEKIIAMQDKLMPALKEYGKEHDIPSDLRRAMEHIEMWDKEVAHEEGHDKGYREWPPKQFANALREHIAMFPNHTEREWIQEYERLVEKLPYDADREHV